MPTFFEIVADTLDRSYKDIDDSEKDGKIKKCLDELSKIYSNVLATGGPDYASPITRFAYVFRYSTAHADYLNSIIGWSSDLRELLKRERVDISCIGGGPGSDVLGFLKFFLSQKKTNPQLTFFILDKEAAWGETWADLDAIVSKELMTSRSYFPLDVTKPESYEKFSRPYKSDIFTMLYFLSEVFRYKDAVTPFFTYCFSNMNKGALLAVLDFADTRLEEWIGGCAKQSGMNCLTSLRTDITMSSSEEKNALKNYIGKFGAPKLQAKVFVRVFRKS